MSLTIIEQSNRADRIKSKLPIGAWYVWPEENLDGLWEVNENNARETWVAKFVRRKDAKLVVKLYNERMGP